MGPCSPDSVSTRLRSSLLLFRRQRPIRQCRNLFGSPPCRLSGSRPVTNLAYPENGRALPKLLKPATKSGLFGRLSISGSRSKMKEHAPKSSNCARAFSSFGAAYRHPQSMVRCMLHSDYKIPYLMSRSCRRLTETNRAETTENDGLAPAIAARFIPSALDSAVMEHLPATARETLPGEKDPLQLTGDQADPEASKAVTPLNLAFTRGMLPSHRVR
jgi:hypothetical protein